MAEQNVADVLIVDGGTSYEVAAKHLATKGLSVVVLEQGHWASLSDFPGAKSANRYVIDGSVFTTSTGVNPTATICALAKRTATYIVDQARREGVLPTHVVSEQSQELSV
jgi:choline dehydrogenase-like flavoprotein